MRIICCGNRNRGDDAAGLLVYDRVRELGIEAELSIAQPLELIETWKDADDVIVIDAVVTGAAPGTIHHWDGNAAHFPAIRSTSTHGFGIAEAIQLARRIGHLPKNLHVYGIEARQFDVGSEPSPPVREAAEMLARQLAAELSVNVGK